MEAAKFHALYRRAVLKGAAPRYTAREVQAWAGRSGARPLLMTRLARSRIWVAGPGRRGFLTATPEGYIDLFFVEPEERGGPVARTLYAAFTRWAEDEGLERLTAHGSRLLRPFLERRGWRVVHAERNLLRGARPERFFMERPGTDVARGAFPSR